VVRSAIESASRFAVKSPLAISSNDAKRKAPGSMRRAADGLLGECAAWARLARREFQVATMLSNSRRITIRSCQGRYSPSGDSTKANTRRGVFRVKISEPSSPLRATMTHAHSLDAQFLGKQVQGDNDEGCHQKGSLGGARANSGGDGHARHRRRCVLCAVSDDRQNGRWVKPA
jgi:hypothetical protein